MALIEKMTEYWKVVFATADAKQAASDALMNYATSSPVGLMSMVGPNRIVVWDDAPIHDRTALYVSPGALAILQKLVTVPPAETIPPDALPEDRAMLLGDASDWGR